MLVLRLWPLASIIAGKMDIFNQREHMDSKPAISVVMSCYNAASYLDEAITSVLCQSFSDFEFILINDGSCDHTWDIIKGYADIDNRIVPIDKKNSGLTDCLNLGLSWSRGIWIARLDADDVALPTRFEEQISFLKASPDVVLLGTDFIEINQAGRFVKHQSYPRTHDRLLRNLKNLGRFFPHSSAMYRREIAGNVCGGYNPRVRYAQDWDLWLRFSEVGRIACLNSPLVKIRKHGDQISNSDSGRTQAVYGMAATVCYFLRSFEGVDPSRADQPGWEAFLKWLSVRLEQEGYFADLQGWATVRKSFLAGSKMLAVPRLLKDPRSWTQIYRHLEQSLCGTRLPQKLAGEWSVRR